MDRIPLLALLGASALLATTGCKKKSTQPSDPCEGFKGVCLDLSPYVTDAGSGAMAKIAAEADLIGGVAAQGRAGDALLANDLIRVLVQGARRSAGIAPWGGNILDADIVRPEGEAGRDGWDELFMLIDFGRTLAVDEVRIFRDGSDGGSAVVAVAGHDTLNDVLNVPYLLESFLGSVGKVWTDPNQDLKLNITTYYILDPGASKVRTVTAFRNESDAAYPFFVVEQFARGGYAELFNPIRTSGSRFGYTDALPEAADAYLAHVTGDVAYGVLPVETFGEKNLPNIAMTVSGTTNVLLGGENLFDFVGGPDVPDPLPPGAIELGPGETQTVVLDFAVARDLAGVTAEWDRLQGTALGRVEGKVNLAGGDVPSGTRVTVLDDSGRPYTVFAVEADGSFGGPLAAGTYEAQADAPGYPYSPSATLTVEADKTATLTLDVTATATVQIHVHDPAGAPIPAKVTFVCPGTCPKDLGRTGRHFRDVDYDGLPANVQAVAWVPVSGTLDVLVPPGDYQVVVSRGPEWSVFPAGWPNAEHAITATAGQTVQVEAELAHVLDTTGWITADLHVHGVNSPDAPILHLDRVASFLAAGVDVIVSTDHDFVTDWAPYVKELGAEDVIATVVGEELTTFDWGHFNAFPLQPDPDEVQGGALDWGNGANPTLTPHEVFQKLKEMPGGNEKVVQVNHPRGGMGYFTSIGLDFLTGKTATDPAVLHMPTDIVEGDDTGLFDTSFTAIEILNGRSLRTFTPRFNDWLALLQRGVTRTATAVTDTHRAYSGDMGSPYTYVRVGSGEDTPATFKVEDFVHALNQGRASGTTGPFVTVTATSGGQSVGIGEVLALSAPGASVDLQVEIQIPDWLTIDTIDLYANTTGLEAKPYEQMNDLPAPAQTISVDLSQEATVPGAGIADANTPYRRWVITRTFTVTPTEDTWYVILVRGSDASGFPALLEPAPALAFTNPVFVDADGGGYQAPQAFEAGARRVWHRARPRWEVEHRRPTQAEMIDRLRRMVHHH